MDTADLRSVIYLDIETWSGTTPLMGDIKAPANYKDPAKILQYQKDNHDKEWRKQSLDAHKGEVFCVGLAIDDNEPFCLVGEAGIDEKGVLEQLDKELQNYSYPTIVGHNLLDFDALWLFYKGLKYRLANVVNAFSNKSSLRDTMKMMDGPSWKTMVSLDKMCTLLGFEGKGDISGADVHDLIKSGQGNKVCTYCISDVSLLRQCYKELSKYGLA